MCCRVGNHIKSSKLIFSVYSFSSRAWHSPSIPHPLNISTGSSEHFVIELIWSFPFFTQQLLQCSMVCIILHNLAWICIWTFKLEISQNTFVLSMYNILCKKLYRFRRVALNIYINYSAQRCVFYCISLKGFVFWTLKLEKSRIFFALSMYNILCL